MTATPKVNYTEAMVNRMLEMYENKESVEAIADALGKPTRSVISKLVREGVYQAPEKPAPKAKVEGPTKKEILRDLEAAGFDVTGLEPATKDAIARVLALVANQAAQAA
jgi:hypothetical protein